MNGAGIQSNAAPAVPAIRWRWALGLAAAAVLWIDADTRRAMVARLLPVVVKNPR